MEGRALYNLLRIQCEEDPSTSAEQWQVEDYRALPKEELFRRLRAFDLNLHEPEFLAYAEHCDSPEEIAECLWDRGPKTVDFQKIYLLVFELWRKCLPLKQSYSLFCDELDLLIGLYDKGLLADPELIEDALADLEDLLDEEVDKGEKPQQVLKKIADYLAHDLESFLIDYIGEQIDGDDDTTASELLDAFGPYFQDKRWERLLRARLFAHSNIEAASILFNALLEELREDFNLVLLKTLTEILVYSGESSLFLESAGFLLNHLKTEGEFQTLLGWAREYFRCLDQDDQVKVVADFLNARKTIPYSTPLLLEDPIRRQFDYLMISTGTKLR